MSLNIRAQEAHKKWQGRTVALNAEGTPVRDDGRILTYPECREVLQALLYMDASCEVYIEE